MLAVTLQAQSGPHRCRLRPRLGFGNAGRAAFKACALKARINPPSQNIAANSLNAYLTRVHQDGTGECFVAGVDLERQRAAGAAEHGCAGDAAA